MFFDDNQKERSLFSTIRSSWLSSRTLRTKGLEVAGGRHVTRFSAIAILPFSLCVDHVLSNTTELSPGAPGTTKTQRGLLKLSWWQNVEHRSADEQNSNTQTSMRLHSVLPLRALVLQQSLFPGMDCKSISCFPGTQVQINSQDFTAECWCCERTHGKIQVNNPIHHTALSLSISEGKSGVRLEWPKFFRASWQVYWTMQVQVLHLAPAEQIKHCLKGKGKSQRPRVPNVLENVPATLQTTQESENLIASCHRKVHELNKATMWCKASQDKTYSRKETWYVQILNWICKWDFAQQL